MLSVLEELDERTRDAFILHRLEGMKHAEIASAAGRVGQFGGEHSSSRRQRA